MIDFSLSPLAGDPAAEDAQRSGQPSTSGAKGASSSQRVIKVETDIEDFEQCMWTSLMPPCPGSLVSPDQLSCHSAHSTPVNRWLDRR